MRYLILALMISIVVVGCGQPQSGIIEIENSYEPIPNPTPSQPTLYIWSPSDEASRDYVSVYSLGDIKYLSYYEDPRESYFLHPTGSLWKVVVSEEGTEFKCSLKPIKDTPIYIVPIGDLDKNMDEVEDKIVIEAGKTASICLVKDFDIGVIYSDGTQRLISIQEVENEGIDFSIVD